MKQQNGTHRRQMSGVSSAPMDSRWVYGASGFECGPWCRSTASRMAMKASDGLADDRASKAVIPSLDPRSGRVAHWAWITGSFTALLAIHTGRPAATWARREPKSGSVTTSTDRCGGARITDALTIKVVWYDIGAMPIRLLRWRLKGLPDGDVGSKFAGSAGGGHHSRSTQRSDKPDYRHVRGIIGLGLADKSRAPK
jgi:hypothetical protein